MNESAHGRSAIEQQPDHLSRQRLMELLHDRVKDLPLGVDEVRTFSDEELADFISFLGKKYEFDAAKVLELAIEGEQQ